MAKKYRKKIKRKTGTCLKCGERFAFNKKTALYCPHCRKDIIFGDSGLEWGLRQYEYSELLDIGRQIEHEMAAGSES